MTFPLRRGEQLLGEKKTWRTRRSTRGTQDERGTLYVTDQRFSFVGKKAGSVQVPWSSVVDVKKGFLKVRIETTGRSGAIVFAPDSLKLLQSAWEKWRERASDPRAKVRSRSISNEVRSQVWIRDKGMCVECGASEDIQFDHVIPFSKGGSSSAQNMQLLCQSCNVRKSDRI